MKVLCNIRMCKEEIKTTSIKHANKHNETTFNVTCDKFNLNDMKKENERNCEGYRSHNASGITLVFHRQWP